MKMGGHFHENTRRQTVIISTAVCYSIKVRFTNSCSTYTYIMMLGVHTCALQNSQGLPISMQRKYLRSGSRGDVADGTLSDSIVSLVRTTVLLPCMSIIMKNLLL